MDFKQLEKDILANRGNVKALDLIIANVKPLRDRYDWEIDKFLRDHCKGVRGIEELDLDTSNPLYRYYNHKCSQYESVERIIRVANAFK